jgi:hypothetical protein
MSLKCLADAFQRSFRTGLQDVECTFLRPHCEYYALDLLFVDFVGRLVSSHQYSKMNLVARNYS